MPPKNKRLDKESIEVVFKVGKVINSDNVFSKFIKNNLVFSRISVIASKKQFKTAVERNSQKRRLYHCINIKNIKPGFDIVFSIKKNLKAIDKTTLNTEISSIIEKIR